MHTGRSGSTDGPACDINIPKVGLAGRVNPTITEAQGGNLFYGINALIIALIGGLYAGYAEDTPADAQALLSLFCFAATFALVCLLNLYARRVLLRRLLRRDRRRSTLMLEATGRESTMLRFLLLFFPSTKPASNVLHRRSLDPMSPRPLVRMETSGAGALEVTEVREMESTKEAALSDAFLSVLYVPAAHAARIALPPVRSALLLVANATVGAACGVLVAAPVAATAFAHYNEKILKTMPLTQFGLDEVAPFLEGAAPAALRLALAVRVLLPIDGCYVGIVSDLLARYDVSLSVRHGFLYFAQGVRAVAWAGLATTALAMSGAELGGTLTMWGIFGFGITLTLQQVAKDAASTLLLFATRPFDVGDTIDAGGGHYGIVKQVDVRHTEITLFSSNQVVSIPNTKLAECRIENYSRMGADTRRTTINVAVHLKTPVAQLREVPAWMRAAAEAADLAVLRSHMTKVDLQGVHFETLVAGPVDFEALSMKKQEAWMLLLETFAKQKVMLPVGNSSSNPCEITA